MRASIFGSLRASILLLAGVGMFAAAMLAAQSAWTQREMNRTAHSAFVAKDVVADILPPPLYLVEMRLVLSQVVEGTMPAADAAREFERLANEYRQRVEYWQAHPPHGLERRLLGAQHEAAQRFIAAAGGTVLPRAAAGDAAGARDALRQAHRIYQEHRAGVDATVVEADAFAKASMSDFATVTGLVGPMTVGVLVVAVLLVAILWRAVSSGIEAPLRAALALADRIAKGDLSGGGPASHAARRRDVIGALDRSLQAMRAQLGGTVMQVRANAEQVAAATAQIAAGNLDLRERTEHQAAALDDAAGTMRELGAAVRRSAEHSESANALALEASRVAERGGAVVGEVVQTMQGIHDSSRRIADIISVIDGIAFQTNILALNAAVEAARAGEQGRGFAVVASEVRSLAGRSAEAAREIAQLITDSVTRVERGTALVNTAGHTMSEVVESIGRVTAIVSGIREASATQDSGVERVAAAVEEMERSTQRNAVLVEQAAGAADGLRGQATALVDSVAVFRV